MRCNIIPALVLFASAAVASEGINAQNVDTANSPNFAEPLPEGVATLQIAHWREIKIHRQAATADAIRNRFYHRPLFAFVPNPARTPNLPPFIHKKSRR
jgi:hypothetical protein